MCMDISVANFKVHRIVVIMIINKNILDYLHLIIILSSISISYSNIKIILEGLL